MPVKAITAEMEKAIDAFKRELSGIRTGRAAPSLIETVQVYVPSYGSNMALKELGNITAPDARLLIVNPWDKSTLGEIERAIGAAGLGLNPSSDGQVVRVPIPALTGDRRKDLVKVVKKAAEEAKIRIRNIRREHNDAFKAKEAKKEISEDDLKRTLDKFQTATDAHIKKIDEISAAKEKEILEV